MKRKRLAFVVVAPAWIAVLSVAAHALDPAVATRTPGEMRSPGTVAPLSRPALFGDETVAGRFGDEFFTRGELAYYLEDRRGAIERLWFERHKRTSVDWAGSVDGRDPVEELIAQALAALAHTRALWREAKLGGLDAPETFAALLTGWERENSRRREVLARGGVIYGPQHFDLGRRMRFENSRLEKGLCDRHNLAASALPPWLAPRTAETSLDLAPGEARRVALAVVAEAQRPPFNREN